jgi:hypothetical protein
MSTKTATMIPSSNSELLDGLKMVKNAIIFSENGIYFIRHYETVIFAYNPESKLAEINWHCSMTSDRQIRSAIDFFNVKKENQIDVSDGVQKWRYSGELRN